MFNEPTFYVVRLDDGETYASIEGCSIVEAPISLIDSGELDEYVKNAQETYDINALVFHYENEEF